VIKTGPNAGQPRTDYNFGVAIPKTQATWAQEPWGAGLYNFAAQEFPQAVARRDFSWKITDGDSVELNKNNKRPCDNEGYPGHWVLFFSTGIQPQLWDYLNDKGGKRLADNDDLIKRGYFVQVMAEYTSNEQTQSPGIYANPRAVALVAYGPIIQGGSVDVSKAGFGQAPLPAGASLTPPAAVPAAAPAPAPAPAAPAPAAPAPVTPARDLVPAGPQMTAKAGGVAYADFIAKGWTDDAMRAEGYLG
jgi:hypothetical protein